MIKRELLDEEMYLDLQDLIKPKKRMTDKAKERQEIINITQINRYTGIRVKVTITKML